MVHVITPRPNLGGVLGSALGSIGAGYANRYVRQQQEQQEESKLQAALGQAQQIYSDPNLTPEQKEMGLYSVLARRPEIAKALSASNLEREKLEAVQGKETRQLEKNRQIIQQIERDKGLPEGSLKAYESNPNLAVKATQEAKKTQASQPIDPDQLKRIQEVREKPEFKEASGSKKYQMLTDNGVSRENSKAEADIAVEEEKTKKEKEKIEKREKIEFHKEGQKYDDDLLNAYKRATNQKESIASIKQAIKSGKVKPASAANILKGMGAIGNKISNAILNADQATVSASIPYLIEGWKEIFGVRLSDADLRIIQDKLPDISKSPEANLAILNIIEKYADMSEMRYEIGQRIKEKNGGLRPLGYGDQLEKQFADSLKPIMIRNPKTGNVVPIPAYRAGDYIKDGGEVVNE